MTELKAKIKAVGLLSGGLDSTLATKLLLDQGIDVIAINFWSPFCNCTAHGAGCPAVVTAIKQLGGDIPLKRVVMGEEYLDIVRHPKHGHGTGLNPCIDCRIMKLKLAGDYMREIGASFLFTGEVLGQRPMSQHREAFRIIDRDSGLGDIILRPLSASYLEPTLPEREGWVDRSKLMNFTGRSRKPQMSLAAEKGINDYPCPAGGCLLTDHNFADRLRDYLGHTDKPTIKDIPLLKTGRHKRMPNDDMVISARDEQEGKQLLALAGPRDHVLVPEFPGPVVILQGKDIIGAIRNLLEHTKKDIPTGACVTHTFEGKKESYRLGDAAVVPREIKGEAHETGN